MTNAQQELDDEILSACHDGELPPTEADAVRRRLAREPNLAERLRAMQRVDEAAVGAFRALDLEPLPERTLELLQAAEAEHRERRSANGNVVAIRGRSGRRPGRRCRWPVALAAGLALATGFWLGVLVPDDGTSLAGTFVGQSVCEPDRGRQSPGGGAALTNDAKAAGGRPPAATVPGTLPGVAS